MRVGDLVAMNFDGWTAEQIALHGDEWGVGIVVESDSEHDYCCVNWSKAGPSWESIDQLDKINER